MCQKDKKRDRRETVKTKNCNDEIREATRKEDNWGLRIVAEKIKKEFL